MGGVRPPSLSECHHGPLCVGSYIQLGALEAQAIPLLTAALCEMFQGRELCLDPSPAVSREPSTIPWGKCPYCFCFEVRKQDRRRRSNLHTAGNGGAKLKPDLFDSKAHPLNHLTSMPVSPGVVPATQIITQSLCLVVLSFLFLAFFLFF